MRSPFEHLRQPCEPWSSRRGDRRLLPPADEIVNEHRGVSPDTAVRLAAFFGTSAEVWMGLQAHVDLYEAQKETERRGTLRKIERARRAIA